MTGAGAPNNMAQSTRALVDLGAIEHNVTKVRELVGNGVEILAVVKADAYGHGAARAAEACERAGAAALGVALVHEGVELRHAGIGLPILVHCLAGEGEIDAIIKNRLMPTVASLAFAEELSRRASEAGATLDVHADIDTGMGRIGFSPESAVKEIAEMVELPGVRLDGLYTHFSTSEVDDDPWTQNQLEMFTDLVERLSKMGIRPPRIHAANSGGVINYPQAHLTLARPGLMLYGVYPHRDLEEKVDLRPALSIETSIAFLKEIPEGVSLGYGRSFISPGPMRIATANVGYADGYPWRLSNNSSALVRETRVPVVGRVSMDQLLLDVTSIPDVELGDRVTLLGSEGAQRISAEDLAEWAGTIPYEILCRISKRVPRVYIGR
jgi:alanine racemase